MMENYIILESKINYLSLTELEVYNSPDITRQISIMEDLFKKEDEIQRYRVIKTAYRHFIENEKPKIKGVYYKNKRDVWTGERSVNGVRYHVKTSKERCIVELAVIKFCKEKNIQI